ncbi:MULTISPECIES: trans-aconitate 2-methyltransferase [Streptacidiphilus]|uniref:Trans-aconitate 2-methyltransferase n=1 Tax=Streptacidiphilus cavernicola TaxID=3342716 RepID=A0ABV6UK54_9ACTN|nr:class I SAM-dependent methyltransferase [Streptacidiphilus jeojiense]
MTPVEGRDLYDDPRFHDGYRRLRATGAGINEALEIPAMARHLPAVQGASVVDLGCGTGALARRLADAEAAEVVAVDASRRMLANAEPHPRVRFIQADLESLSLPSRSADLVVSSMVLHYVADYPALVRRIADWLRPGGRLVFSQEHPICTAHRGMPGWLQTGEAEEGCHIGAGWVWPVDDYASEGPRTQHWILEGVGKHHRRTSTLIATLLGAGLDLTAIEEPTPTATALHTRPELAEHLRRPPILLLAARRRAES